MQTVPVIAPASQCVSGQLVQHKTLHVSERALVISSNNGRYAPVISSGGQGQIDLGASDIFSVNTRL